jgi:hypothetical protein
MSSQPDLNRRSPLPVGPTTTLRWIGVGASSTIEGIQAVMEDPHVSRVSGGPRELFVTIGLGDDASGTMPATVP